MSTRYRAKSVLSLVAVAAAALLLFPAASNGQLLLYEGFDYPVGSSLEGLGSDGNGMIGTWVDEGSGGTLGVDGHTVEADDSVLGKGGTWTGVPAGGMPNTGNFLMGERRDDNSGYRSIDPEVTATFLDGTVTWMSFVSAPTIETDRPDNHHKPNLAIGQGELMDSRADKANGQAIGGGGYKTFNGAGLLVASYWDDNDGDGVIFEEHRGHLEGTGSVARFTPQQLIVMKLEWGPDNDTVSLLNFDIGTDAGYTAPTEAAFDAGAVSITSVNNLDQLTFDTISFHGSRSNFDEFRLGLTFDDVVKGVSVSSFDPTDFDQDGNSNLIDINALTAAADLPIGLPVALSDPKYDLTGDDMINTADLDKWLTDAATINGFGSPYLKGDANLDGDCDVFAIDGSGDAQILSSHLGTANGAAWGDGDFNGDGDVDVFQIDGAGDAQLLSSNLGSSSDAAAGTAAAIYNAVTGELSFDVGADIAVIGVEAEGLDHAAVATDSDLGAPAQNGGGILAYFNASGLPAVMASVGNVLPAGLTAEDIGFSYTPIGGESTVVPVTVVVPEPSTIAMLLVLGAVALCWRRRRA